MWTGVGEWMDGYPLDCYDYQSTFGANNSERPVDALAIKKVNRPLTDNIKSRDASASKNGWYS